MRKLFVLLTLFLFSMAAYASSAVGVVMSATGEAYVYRDNVEKVIVSGDQVFRQDEVVTGPDGRVQVMFIDNTMISVSEDTVLDLSVFEFSEQNEFAVDVTQGIIKLVSGKIVEQNRDGFKINTPQTTIAIRGTVLTVNVGGTGNDAFTRVMINEIAPEHEVIVTNNVTNAVTSFNTTDVMITAGGQGNTVEPATPEAINAPADSAASGVGVAAADNSNNAAGNASSNADSQITVPSVTTPGLPNMPDMGNTPGMNNNSVALYSGTISGTVSSGTMAPTGSALTGTVSMQLNLSDRTVSNFDINIQGPSAGMDFIATGGKGQVNGTTLTMNNESFNYSGNLTTGVNPRITIDNTNFSPEKINGEFRYWNGGIIGNESGYGSFQANRQ